MSRPDKITIAIVTFHQDFQLLENLLNSIYRFWNWREIDSIKIVLNDKIKYKNQFDSLIDKCRIKKFKIDTYYIFEMDSNIQNFDWHSQQMAKCLISKYIDTEWYLIHDCKDLYIEPVCIEDCFDSNGRAIMHIDHARYNSVEEVPYPGSHWGFGMFNLAYQTCCELWGLDPQDYKQRHLPYLTPFFVKTKYMSNMVDELKGMFKQAFSYLFSLYLDGQVFVTEFLIYGSYCLAKNNLADYVDWSYNHRKFYNCIKQSLDGRKTDGSRLMSMQKTDD